MTTEKNVGTVQYIISVNAIYVALKEMIAMPIMTLRTVLTVVRRWTKGEKMARYIDADALIQLGLQDGAYEYVSVQEIADFPTADVVDKKECSKCVFYPFKQLREQVVHGEWIPEPNCYYRCSNCKGHMVSIQNKINYSYCPYCGADMRGGTDGEVL